MQKRVHIAMLSVFCLVTFQIEAQLNGKYTFRHIDQSDGLIHSYVQGIGQDRQGFIWILTEGGLQRYDGTRFVNYTETLDPATGRASSAKLWVDTFNNKICVMKGKIMQRLDPLTSKFTTITLQTFLLEDTLHPPVAYLNERGDEHLISINGGIRYVNAVENELGTWFNENPGTEHTSIDIYEDPVSGNFWGHTYLDFFIADKKTKRIYSTADPEPINPLLKQIRKGIPNPRSIRFFIVDSDRNLWISNWGQTLYRLNLNTYVFKSYSLLDIKKKEGNEKKDDYPIIVNTMFEDRQKNLWIATDYAGLLCYNREKDDFGFITSEDNISNGIRYNYSIFSVSQDKDDNIWLGTDRGISIFNPYRNYFQSIKHVEGISTSIPKNDINDIIETDQGEILVGTWGGGISIFDTHWNFIRNVTFNEHHWQNQVWHFIKNDDGTIWAGAQGGYILIYDPINHSFISLHPPETRYGTITAMAKDHNGNILLGSPNGRIITWSKQNNTFYPFDDNNQLIKAPLTNVWNLFVDRQNHCWAGTDLGLMEFNVINRRYDHFYHPTDSITEILVQGIEQINDSMLMVASMYGGLNFFNLYTRQFEKVLFGSEQINSSVFALKKDKEGDLWMTTNYELIVFDADLTVKKKFNVGKYINTAPFESRSFYELHDGRWVTSTPAELICFDPRQIKKDLQKKSKVVISGFKVFNQYLNTDSLFNNNRPVILPYDRNFISIEFTALDFSSILVNSYSYRLTDVDKNWNSSTIRQFADYTDLKPGEYTFEVKADNGSTSSAITSFPIIITSPWWSTLWFRLTCLLILGFLIYSGVRKRIQNFRKESELKHRIAETEMIALRSQMNPHFIFNCLNSIDNLIQTNQKEKATNYLAKFAKLIRAILENSKNNVIPCWKDLEALALYLDMEALRWDNKIKCHLDIDPRIQLGDYKVPPMIIQPLVENAIHHGLLNKTDADKRLDISVALEGEEIKYTIRDNGVGRTRAAEYKKLNRSSLLSFGLEITQDRVRLFNENKNQSIKITDLYNDLNEAAGTKVEVWLTTQTVIV